MAARFLLNTNILSDLIRHPQGRVAERLIREGEGSVCTSIIVASELRFGAAKCEPPRLAAQLEAVLAAHALAVVLAVVTDNVPEFSRVPGLHVENWLAP